MMIILKYTSCSKDFKVTFNFTVSKHVCAYMLVIYANTCIYRQKNNKHICFFPKKSFTQDLNYNKG